MIKEVIFDLDGTLVDSLDTFIKIGNEMAEKYGYKPISQEKIKELLKLPMRKRIEALEIPIYKLPKMGIELLNNFNSYAAVVKPVKGVGEVLESLSRGGYGLNIVSSNSEHNIRAFLEANNMNLFENIQSSRSLFGKHVTIGKLISKLGVEKDEVIYIGDEQRDVEASKKTGIRVISVLWGMDTRELIEDAGPDFIAASPEEIVDIITAIK